LKNKHTRFVKILTQSIVVLLFLGYLYLLTELLLFGFRTPMGEQSRITYEEYFKNKVNVTPLETIKLYLNHPGYTSTVNILGNIFVFFPMGLFYGYFFKRSNNVILSTVIFAFASLVFESLQMLFLVGSFDVDDILLNTLGGIVGFLLILILKGIQYLSKRKTHRTSTRKSGKRHIQRDYAK